MEASKAALSIPPTPIKCCRSSRIYREGAKVSRDDDFLVLSRKSLEIKVPIPSLQHPIKILILKIKFLLLFVIFINFIIFLIFFGVTDVKPRLRIFFWCALSVARRVKAEKRRL